MKDAEEKKEASPKKRRRRKRGRPKGRTIKPFRETRLGYMMRHETPLEYRILMDVSRQMGRYRKPDPSFVEALAYCSAAPFFRKPKFWRAMTEYRKYGLRSPVRIVTNATRELYYIKRRLIEIRKWHYC